MRSLSVDELFASLFAVELSASALARLREWIASIAHPAACIAPIGQAARDRQRPRCVACGRSHNAPTGTPLVMSEAAATRCHAPGDNAHQRKSG